MTTFTVILLIVILILTASDVYFLWKIFRNINARKKTLPDERYFELKYNINLLKAVSAILIFLIGFLGFTTYQNIVDNVENDFSLRFNEQNIRIDSFSMTLSNYEKFVDSLNLETYESVENLGDINRKFQAINKKLAQNEASLKYTTKVYVIHDLIYPANQGEELPKFEFKNMRTIYGENLPKFKEAPLIITQVKDGLGFYIGSITKDYVSLGIQSSVIRLSNKGISQPSYTFDMWIAEPN